MEEVVIKVDEVVEAAVVVMNDEIKGEIPFAFVVLKHNIYFSNIKIINQIKQKIMMMLLNILELFPDLKE